MHIHSVILLGHYWLYANTYCSYFMYTVGLNTTQEFFKISYAYTFVVYKLSCNCIKHSFG